MDHRDADVSLTDHGLRWKHGKQAATGGEHACDFIDGWREVSDVFEDLIGDDHIKGRIGEGQSIVTNLSDRVAEESLFPESGHDRRAVFSFREDVRSKDLHASLTPCKDDFAEAAPEIETRQRLRLSFQPSQQESVIRCAYLDC
jgi:hypothetical protein